jgi:hypothetical protein
MKHQTEKGNQWYFGMKLHIGVDSQSGLAHRATLTAGRFARGTALRGAAEVSLPWPCHVASPPLHGACGLASPHRYAGAAQGVANSLLHPCSASKSPRPRLVQSGRKRSKYPCRINCVMDVVLAGCDARRPARRSASTLGGPLQGAGNAAARRPVPQTPTISFAWVLRSVAYLNHASCSNGDMQHPV